MLSAREVVGLVFLWGVFLALGCAAPHRRDSAIQPREEACGQVVPRPVDFPAEDLFPVGEWIVGIREGVAPAYAPRATVLDPLSGKWSEVPQDGAPALVQGHNHYSVQWTPLSTRLFGLYSLGLIILDPVAVRWRVLPRPSGFDEPGLMSWGDEVLTASHRFHAGREQLSPAPAWVREHAGTPFRIPLGSRVALLDPAARRGEVIDLETGRRTPIGFEGLPAFSQVTSGSAVGEDRLLVLGRSTDANTPFQGAIHDLGTASWTPIPASTLAFLKEVRLNGAPIHGWGGAWLAEPQGPAGVRDLHILDPSRVTVVKIPLSKGAQVVGAPQGVYAFDGEGMRLFVPGRTDPACSWPLPSVPKNRMALSDGKVLDPAGGLDPYAMILPVDRRILLVSLQTDDHNPSCPPGAPCLPHDEARVVRRTPATLLEWR